MNNNPTSSPDGDVPAHFHLPIPLQRRFSQFMAFAASQEWVSGKLDNATWRTAIRAAGLQIPTELVFGVVSAFICSAGGELKINKIVNQLNRARAFVAGTSNRTSKQKTRGKHEFDPTRLAKAIAPLAEVKDITAFIQDRSPVCVTGISSAQFLRHLYSSEEKILILTKLESQGDLVWTHSVPDARIPSRHPAGVLFLPNPVDGEFHPNPRLQGKPSRRSAESITSFRFALIESDQVECDTWLRFLALLPLPIAAIYLSGRRSVHALIRVDATDKDHWDKIVTPHKPFFAAFGADIQALTAVRLSRLPQAFRGDRQQELLFLNPAPRQERVSALPPREH